MLNHKKSPRISQNTGILKTQGFSKSRDFQNAGILKTQVFSKRRDFQNPGIVVLRNKKSREKILRDKKSSD